ncbi:MAG: serine hydrolase [Tissierellales bacterium]|nr:serine hydrolase [Tissierellales bacterium]
MTKYNTDAEIEHLMIKHDLPSISACVIKNNSIVWQCIYGFSNRETQLEATQETIYHIASISKLFIVTAFMQLEEQGIVDLNQDINEYLPISIRNPNFPDKPITSMMLLTHTASLASTKTDADAPGIWKEFQTDQAPPLSEWIPQFLIPSGKFYSPTIWKLYEPKQLELYSNVGSCLLAYIAEQLTGQDFRDYCRDHIFGPLAMRNTSYLYSDLDRNKIAILYQNNNAVHLFFDFLLNASGGAKTTINDMARFLIAYMNGGELDGMRVLAESSVEKILTVQNNISGRCLTWSASFGGWFGHSGGLDAGAKSIAEIHPQSKIGFIIFCNKSLSPIDHGDEIYGLVRQKANEYIE